MASLKLTDKGIFETIRERQRGILGESSASALDFYADARIAPGNPGSYATLVRNLLGPGADKLLQAIMEALYQKVGLQRVDDASFEDCIKAVRIPP